jgi:nifR3 family TIM-barrel protein
LTAVADEERPAAVQIFGSDPDIMAAAAEKISEYADVIDINMGCPAPKVVKNDDGSKLMLNLDLVDKITEKVVKASKVPVTVKTRKGWDDEHVSAVDIARICEKNGVAAIAIHGRTRNQFYTGSADWNIIADVKKAVSIPVIGNGDVTGPESAKKMIEETGVDGIMIGRAARGNPWIFGQIRDYLETGVLPQKPSLEEVREMMLRHARMQLECKGEYTGIREMRKHVAWYTAGYPNSAKLRAKINEVETYEALTDLLKG